MSDLREQLLSLAGAEPNSPSSDAEFQYLAQLVHSDANLRSELGKDMAMKAVGECRYPENYTDITTICAIGLLAEIQSQSGSGARSETCTELTSAICYATSERIIAEGLLPQSKLEDGYVQRDALWLLRDVAAILRNEFSTRPPSRASTSGDTHASGLSEVNSHEMERFLEFLLDVAEGGTPASDVSQFIYPTALSLCVLLSSATIRNLQLVSEYRDNAVSIMSRRLFAGKHNGTSSRSTATPIEVQLCLPVMAIMTQSTFDNSLARPLQFKLLSERTSTVETILAMILSLTDAALWQEELKVTPIGHLDLLKHYEPPTNIVSAAIRTLSLTATARLGEDLILSLLRYASLLQSGTAIFASVKCLSNRVCEKLMSALSDFEREHDNHDESLYESIFVTLEGLGRIYADATSSDAMLRKIRISKERELAADVIRSIEAVSNNPEVPLTNETRDIAECALDEWEVVYKRRFGPDLDEDEEEIEDVTSGAPQGLGAAMAVGSATGVAVAAASPATRRPLQPGAVAMANEANDPQARKMATFSHSGGDPVAAPGAVSVANAENDPQARKMAAFGAAAATSNQAQPGAAASNSADTREISKATAMAFQGGARAVSPSDGSKSSAPESALKPEVQQTAFEKARAKIAQDEQDRRDKGNKLRRNSSKNAGGVSLSAAAEQRNFGSKPAKNFDSYGNQDHSLPPGDFYGQSVLDSEKNGGAARLAVAVAIDQEEEEKLIVAAEEFDPEDRPPVWKNPRFFAGLAFCFVIVIAIAVAISIVVSKKVVTTASQKPQTYRDSLGFYEKFAAISGNAVYEQGSPQYMAAQYIVNVDGRELAPTDHNLIQRYVLALIFTSLDGWNWKWCGGVQDKDTCVYPCWEVDEDCAIDKCKVYQNETQRSKYAGECDAKRFLEDAHECDWYGVNCQENADGNLVVTELYLSEFANLDFFC